METKTNPQAQQEKPGDNRILFTTPDSTLRASKHPDGLLLIVREEADAFSRSVSLDPKQSVAMRDFLLRQYPLTPDEGLLGEVNDKLGPMTDLDAAELLGRLEAAMRGA